MGINKQISKQFSNPTGIGGKIISSIMNQQNRPLYEETIRLLPPVSDDDSVLDLGCGNGYVLNMLANCSGSTLTGIDYSPSAIKDAMTRNRKFVKDGRIKLICRDMSRLPFSDYSFDKAYTINTVYFWENLDGIMTEICRVLKPNGIFINALYTNETLANLSHTEHGYKRFTPNELTNAGINARFSVDIVPVFNKKAYCVVCRKK
jgi:ubiquinone/menaquinone biosynthesis C-methylase UbiE